MGWASMASWSESPVLWNSTGLFMFIYAIGFFVVFKRWRGRPRYDAASCCISFVHGTVSAALAAREIFSGKWVLDAPNTLRQNQIMEYSMAYFVVDLLNYFVAAPDDYLFIGHHIATFTYMFSCRYYTGFGATSVMCLIAAGEATSPVQNVWTISRMAKAESPLAKRIYTSLSPFFTVYFTIVRGMFGPYLIWVLGNFYLRGMADAVVPRWLAYCWVFKIAFAIFGSIIWVYKLWLGLIKFYRTKKTRPRTADAATEDMASTAEAVKKSS